MHTETHEATVRAWFSTETMPAAWLAADPAACAELAQLLRDKVLKAYQMGLLDGAARRTAMRDQAIMDADSALGECLSRMLEAKYLANEINSTFAPLWGGDGNDPRKGGEFIHRMEIASGLVVRCSNDALEALEAAQAALGLNGTTETDTKPFSAA